MARKKSYMCIASFDSLETRQPQAQCSNQWTDWSWSSALEFFSCFIRWENVSDSCSERSLLPPLEFKDKHWVVEFDSWCRNESSALGSTEAIGGKVKVTVLYLHFTSSYAVDQWAKGSDDFSLLAVAKQLDGDDTSVSLCQVRARSDDAIIFEDQALLSLLSVLKMNDFRIGQPVWGPSDTLLYLCEHRLKVGVKHATLDKELNAIIKYAGASSRYLAWTCVWLDSLVLSSTFLFENKSSC